MLLSSDRESDIGEAGFPYVSIDTVEDDAITKDAYVPCRISVVSESHPLSDADAVIKGHGNSTWHQPKKPYNIKFDERTDLFGNGPAKTWVLIANYLDPSMIRNYMSYSVAEALGVEYTTTVQFANLVLNGEYQGLYLVTEKIQIGENRVDIRDPEDGVCFIVELDKHAESEGAEGTDYFVADGKAYSIKDPDCTPDQVESIKAFMEKA